MAKKVVIVGGVAGGATAAARARRLDESAEIVMFERGAEVSFANCGLPYHIGGEIANRNALLVQTKAGLESRFRLDVRTRSEVTRIDRAARRVEVRELETGRVYEESYDQLLLSPGAAPFVPPIPGTEHPAVCTLRNMSDMDHIKARVDGGAQTALVVGGGFIGLEMAENLRRRGLDVALVELLPQVMPPLDPEVAAALHRELVAGDVQLYLADGVVGLEDRGGAVRAQLKSGTTIEADLVVLAVGVRPDTGLARAAGLELTERGAIVVDERMRTSDPAIWAVGDAVQVRDAVLGGMTMMPLAGPANRQARLAVDDMFGRAATYRGAQGTSVVRVFGLTAGLTGASEKVLKARGVEYRKVYVHRPQHVGYFPGAQPMMIKLLFAPGEGRVLGAQIVGREGVDKRIDVVALAVQAGMTVHDLEAAELAYAPQYGAAKDPVNIAGYVAANLLSGDEAYVYAEELDEAGRGRWTIVDVSEPGEFEAGHVPGARLIPLGELRARWREIPTDKPIAVYCAVGQRGYYATRVLRAMGLTVKNLAGGYATYRLVHFKNSPRRHGGHGEGRGDMDGEARGDMVRGAGCAGGTSGTEARRYEDKMVGTAHPTRMETVRGADPTQTTQTARTGRVELDVRGLQCPGPLARLGEAARTHAAGTVLAVVADDPGFAADVQGWCRRGGHAVVAREETATGQRVEIVLGGAGKPAGNPASGHAVMEVGEPVGAVDSALAHNKTFVVFSGDLDRVMAAFVLANAAVDMGDRVTLFFTFWGLNALRRDEAVAVRKDFMSRMFGWMMPRGAGRLKLSKMNMGGMGTAMMKGVMRRKRVADLPTLIADAQRKGVRIVACSMSMDVMGLKREELIDGVEIAGAGGYLASASESGVNLFI